MTKKTNLVSKISLTSGLALAFTLAVWWSVAAQAADDKHDHHAHQGHHAAHLNHIMTQAQAEALKPGDTIAMACSKCKHVMVQHVTKDNSHVKLMTIGQKHKCVCGGTVTVVGTGKGQGKNEQVNHVCSKCGDDVMFVCATKPGSGDNHHHKHDKE
jgi:DNA-directed RNA polymerase subunit M/transcription elongation factor TFIIS